MTTVLITGKHGQLGQELLARAPENVRVIATSRDVLDLADGEACRTAVLTHRPDWVLNTGAYTAVDKAESEPDLAHAVNAGAPAAFASALAETGGSLLQVSTDFVFSGEQGYPYKPEQSLQPLGVYGKSKADGEMAVEQALAPEKRCILRTSWVYGPVGKNFCLTMLRLHHAKRLAQEPLAVVADQVGCPTSTSGLASACWQVINRNRSGVFHWSDAGAASWYDFAVAIGEIGESQGYFEKAAEVKPIRTEEYPTPARRPSYSLLDCGQSWLALGINPLHWRQALARVISRIPPS